MAVEIHVKVKNLRQVQKAIQQAPALGRKYLTQGIHAAIFRIEEEAHDRDNLRFKNPTGRLESSFKQGMELRTLYGAIAPTVPYAVWVHQGHRQDVGRYVPAIGKRLVQPRVKGNPFMERIARSSESRVNEEINKAMDAFVNNVFT